MKIKKVITLTALSALILAGCSTEKAKEKEGVKSEPNVAEEKQVEEVVEEPEEVTEKILSSEEQLDLSHDEIAEYFLKENPPEAAIIIEVAEDINDRSSERMKNEGENFEASVSHIIDFLPSIISKFEEVSKNTEQENLNKISTEVLSLAKEISKETEDGISEEAIDNLNGKYIEMTNKIFLLNSAANPNFYEGN